MPSRFQHDSGAGRLSCCVASWSIPAVIRQGLVSHFRSLGLPQYVIRRCCRVIPLSYGSLSGPPREWTPKSRACTSPFVVPPYAGVPLVFEHEASLAEDLVLLPNVGGGPDGILNGVLVPFLNMSVTCCAVSGLLCRTLTWSGVLSKGECAYWTCHAVSFYLCCVSCDMEILNFGCGVGENSCKLGE